MSQTPLSVLLKARSNEAREELARRAQGAAFDAAAWGEDPHEGMPWWVARDAGLAAVYLAAWANSAPCPNFFWEMGLRRESQRAYGRGW